MDKHDWGLVAIWFFVAVLILAMVLAGPLLMYSYHMRTERIRHCERLSPEACVCGEIGHSGSQTVGRQER